MKFTREHPAYLLPFFLVNTCKGCQAMLVKGMLSEYTGLKKMTALFERNIQVLQLAVLLSRCNLPAMHIFCFEMQREEVTPGIFVCTEKKIIVATPSNGLPKRI